MEKTDFPALFAAKTDPDDAGVWLPLNVHQEDTGEVIVRLFRRLPEATLCAIGMERETCRRLLAFLALVHDIGKSTRLFQSEITDCLPEARERLERAGFSVPSPGELNPGRSHHALAGGCILTKLGCPACLAEIVGAHHGKPQDTGETTCEEQLGGYSLNYYDEKDEPRWEHVWESLLRRALEKSGFSSVEALPQKLTIQAQMLFSGLLVMADWIASSPRYFPLIPVECLRPETPEHVRGERAWEKLALPECWQSTCFGMEADAFRERFGFLPNDVQQAVLKQVANASDAGMVLLEAQMGVGKTEAALGAAEILAAQRGSGGLYFGLPSQATANGIFPRLMEWAESQSQDVAHAIRLAHGTAELNETYARIGEAALTSEEGGLVVHQWFSGKKQALLAEFVIGTIDQLLMASLKRKHVMLRHLGLAGKVVIIDECHAYDAYMSRYLDRTLTWLGSYRVPVVVLSATLPARRRTELICAYLGRKTRESNAAWGNSRGYPLLTWTDGAEVFQQSIPYKGPEKSVRVCKLAPGGLGEYLRSSLRDGGCAGVIVNTVKRAQEVAGQLRRQIPECEVMVFHAGYLLPDRAKKEKELLRRLGKQSAPEVRNRLIVVGTQVLEQSLDYDVDLLVTDLCPMDLLLQRIGRLHRHDRVRPAALREAVCAVLLPEDGSFEKGGELIYGKWLLWRTRELLPEKITLPGDIPQLVQDTYSENSAPEDAQAEEMRAAYQREEKKRKNNAGAFCMDAPRDRKFWCLLNADIGDTEARAQAAVRDGDASVEVLMLVEDGAQQVRLLSGACGEKSLQTSHVPSNEECAAVARQRIRLPHSLCVPCRIENTLRELEEQTQRRFAEWQQSPLLRGELVLLLQPDLTASLAGFRLRYSEQDGLEFEKEDAE